MNKKNFKKNQTMHAFYLIIHYVNAANIFSVNYFEDAQFF